MLVTDPDNPEYLLRHYHVRTHGGVETSTDDEALLRAMMDGPLSDTMLRVKEIGRGLMPGNPLFEQQAQRDAAVRVLAGKPDGAGGNTVVEDAGSTTGIGTLDENAGSGTGIDSLTEVDEEDAEILDFTRSVGLDAGDTEPDDAASGTASDSASEDDDAVDPAFLKTVTLTLVPKPDEDEAARRCRRRATATRGAPHPGDRARSVAAGIAPPRAALVSLPPFRPPPRIAPCPWICPAAPAP